LAKYLRNYVHTLVSMPSFKNQKFFLTTSPEKATEGQFISYRSGSNKKAEYYFLHLPLIQYNCNLSQYLGATIIFSWLINKNNEFCFTAGQALKLLDNSKLDVQQYVHNLFGKNLSSNASQSDYIDHLTTQAMHEKESKFLQNIIYIKSKDNGYNFDSEDTVQLTRLFVRFKSFFMNRTDALILLFDRPNRCLTQCLLSKVNDETEVVVSEKDGGINTRNNCTYIQNVISFIFERDELTKEWYFMATLNRLLSNALNKRNMHPLLLEQAKKGLNIQEVV